MIQPEIISTVKERWKSSIPSSLGVFQRFWLRDSCIEIIRKVLIGILGFIRGGEVEKIIDWLSFVKLLKKIVFIIWLPGYLELFEKLANPKIIRTALLINFNYDKSWLSLKWPQERLFFQIIPSFYSWHFKIHSMENTWCLWLPSPTRRSREDILLTNFGKDSFLNNHTEGYFLVKLLETPSRDKN